MGKVLAEFRSSKPVEMSGRLPEILDLTRWKQKTPQSKLGLAKLVQHTGSGYDHSGSDQERHLTSASGLYMYTYLHIHMWPHTCGHMYMCAYIHTHKKY